MTATDMEETTGTLTHMLMATMAMEEIGITTDFTAGTEEAITTTRTTVTGLMEDMGEAGTTGDMDEIMTDITTYMEGIIKT